MSTDMSVDITHSKQEHNIKVADKWYEHTLETVTENENENETWATQLGHAS